MSVPFESRPLVVYRVLRAINPSPYMFFIDLGDTQVVGSSPEVMVRVQQHRITLRPIAGTRHRGNTPQEDERLEKELLNDPKERAEHLMLIDLGRNDVGKVARTGPVKLTETMVVERYSHVMHIVSQVDTDLAIAIRTAVIRDGVLHVQAGAGIVANSDPEMEWQETINKGKALIAAVNSASAGL
jgi:anthranilate synthase component 1